jgi:hypothetical protein
MTDRIRSLVLCIAAIVLTTTGLAAQVRWGRAPVPRNGACFYEHADFAGQYFCVRRGEDVGVLPDGMNDQISSIRIFGDAEVIVFQDGRFRGESARFGADVRDLQHVGWNDQVSSIRVSGGSWQGRGRAPVWGRAAVPREGACFYSDTNFRGEYFCVPRGASYAELPRGFNDRITSIRVMGARVMIFSDVDYRGPSVRIESDVQNLGGRWNDRVSSIRVY